MPNEIVPVLRGTVLDEESGLTLDHSAGSAVNERLRHHHGRGGNPRPEGENPATWRFPGTSVTHVRIVVRLQRDLGINLAGAALVLDLLERLARSRGRS